jgi:hypothetical protein
VASENSSRISSQASPDYCSRDAEDAGQDRQERFDVAADCRAAEVEEEAGKGAGDVGAVLERQIDIVAGLPGELDHAARDDCRYRVSPGDASRTPDPPNA